MHKPLFPLISRLVTDNASDSSQEIGPSSLVVVIVVDLRTFRVCRYRVGYGRLSLRNIVPGPHTGTVLEVHYYV